MRYSMMDLLAWTTGLAVFLYWLGVFSKDIAHWEPMSLAAVFSWTVAVVMSAVCTSVTISVGFIGWLVICELLQIWARGK